MRKKTIKGMVGKMQVVGSELSLNKKFIILLGIL